MKQLFKILIGIGILLCGCDKKPDDVVISFVVRQEDRGNCALQAEDGSLVAEVNVVIPYGTTLRARGKVPNAGKTDSWKWDGYYIGEEKLDIEQLKDMQFQEDTKVELRCFPDEVGVVNGNPDGSKYHPDGLDDRKYHVVQFCNYDGTILRSILVEDGLKVEVPTDLIPVREGFTFRGWYRLIDEPIHRDTVMEPFFSQGNIEYVVTFVVRAGDPGTLSFTHKKVKVGEPIGELPTYSLTDEESQEGWELDGIYFGPYLWSQESLMKYEVADNLILEYRAKK